MQDQTTEQFKSWGLLELMGRQRVAGELSESTIGGCSFIRVDVPQVGDIAAHTRYFTSSAIYGMTPLAEATARKLANYLQSAPVSAYELRDAPAAPLLTSESSHEDYFPEDDRNF
ncbi:hypothetical protein O4H66_17130 [Comamonadaceae bacterium G21597-S1]|nr:hypothetical protein [Comamonadaceae bacterium G21597-S1]